MFKINNNEVVSSSSSGKANKIILNLAKKSRNLTYMLNIRAIRELTFLIPNAKNTFNYLGQIFIEALILKYFDLKCHIKIEIDVSGYAISKVLSWLNFKEIILFDFG